MDPASRHPGICIGCRGRVFVTGCDAHGDPAIVCYACGYVMAHVPIRRPERDQLTSLRRQLLDWPVPATGASAPKPP